MELKWCNPIRKSFILVLLVVLSPCFVFVVGAEIPSSARSATFLRKPELMQKNLLKELCIIKLIEKNGQLSTG